jgi:hypothetical protein
MAGKVPAILLFHLHDLRRTAYPHLRAPSQRNARRTLATPFLPFCGEYPGQAGAQFMQQYAQAGLKDSIPIYSVFTVDALTLPQIKEQAFGHLSTQE